ncbi:MAG: hypothetical protein N4A57_04890 [Anaeromicrobium sp.]|jgi:hypothetical protein|nr:hypothetical protein [Anaeromicrobium sp.]MCT4593594.1 hypothetical protein [Anaeromicrobium sp.]
MAKITWKTDEDIKDEKLLEKVIPTCEEVNEAKIEIQVLNLLEEVGVI